MLSACLDECSAAHNMHTLFNTYLQWVSFTLEIKQNAKERLLIDVLYNVRFQLGYVDFTFNIYVCVYITFIFVWVCVYTHIHIHIYKQ